MRKISRALISVHDKTGAAELGAFLSKRGVNIIATSGTAKALEKKGVKVAEISKITGFPDMLDGKVKTLHPIIITPIIADRSNGAHMESLKSIGAEPIDLVVVNIPQPPEPDPGDEEKYMDVVSSISVGAGALMRAAALNYPAVTVLTGPDQYKDFMEQMKKNDGKTSKETRLALAMRAFEIITFYDMAVHKLLSRKGGEETRFPDILFLKYKKAFDLRYGENPHQKASFYRKPGFTGVSLCNAVQLKGSTLSYNNVTDLTAALEIVLEFDKTAAVVVKHGNPIGVAVDKDPHAAYVKARDVDPHGAFGGVVAINGNVDKRTADELVSTFIEAAIAPRYTEGALAQFESCKKSTHIRIVEMPVKKWAKTTNELDVREVLGGALVQENNDLLLPRGGYLKVFTKRKPTRKQLADMILAWKVCKHVRSNAVVLARDLQTVGTGAGQMNCLDSLRIAIQKAGGKALGAVMASDAFIPFRDVIDEAARQGIAAIIQPGGSPGDDEIITASDEHNISLAVAGMRHFKQ